MIYLVKLATSSTGETYGVLIEARSPQEAKIKAENRAREEGPYFYHTQGTYEVNADWR